MNVTHAKDAFAEAFQYAIEELDGLIIRRFALTRTITIEPENDKWIVVIDGDTVLWRGYDQAMALAWLRAFLAKPENDNVVVHGMADLLTAHSYRVPDNVIEMPVRA